MCGAGLLVATFHMKIERKKQIPFLFGPELGNTKISDLNGFCNNNDTKFVKYQLPKPFSAK